MQLFKWLHSFELTDADVDANAFWRWPDVFLIYKVSIVYSRDGNAAHWGFDTASQVVTFLLTNHATFFKTSICILKTKPAPFSETLICILKTSNVLWMSACFSFQCDIVSGSRRQTGHSAEGKAQLEIASSTITPNTTTALHCHSMHCHLHSWVRHQWDACGAAGLHLMQCLLLCSSIWYAAILDHARDYHRCRGPMIVWVIVRHRIWNVQTSAPHIWKTQLL